MFELFVNKVWGAADHFQLANTLCRPSLTLTNFSLGCDVFGRDLGYLLLRGGLKSIGLALFLSACLQGVALSISLFGISVSIKVRQAIHRILDFFLVFPSILIALALSSILKQGTFNLALALFVGFLPSSIKALLGYLEHLMHKEWYKASVALGKSPMKIVLTEILPYALDWVFVKIPGLVASMILVESTLTFLGIGVPIGNISWGALLGQARDYWLEAPHIALFTGLTIFCCVLCVQWLAERGLRARKVAGKFA